MVQRRTVIIIRTLDIVISIIIFLAGIPLFIVIYIFVVLDVGAPFYVQKRVGKDKQAFALIKFRTMKQGTKSVATHLADASCVTPLGKFLRKTKLDELPQLWNVLNGNMSLVGPRPCLFNQYELIREREALRVFSVRPGITGLAQVQGVDMSTPKLLSKIDRKLIDNLNIKSYLVLILKTAIGRGVGDALKK